MTREAVNTDQAPKAIGTYSQAVKASGTTVYLSGQIPLPPGSMELVRDPREQVHQVFRNLDAVARASGGTLADVVKLTIYLTDLGEFGTVNEVMAEYFDEPYPARAAIGVASLPRGALVEIEGVMSLGG